MNFQHLYLQAPAPSEREAQLRQLAERYVRETEQYDLSVCTGPTGRYGVMPATPRERALIEKNARDLFQRLAGQVMPNATRAELRRAICDVERQGLRA